MSIKVNIQKKFKDFQLQVDFETKGKRVGILGASGCGKSMTLKCIAGIEKPDRGQILAGNELLFDSKDKINVPPQKRKIGYLFQNYALFPHMTVAQNIGIGIRKAQKDKDEKNAIIEAQLKRFHLEGLSARRPIQLSGGQQQRVALARIFAYEPDVILLDEPFSALDQYLKDQLQQELLETFQDFKGDMMIVSHNRDELYTLCDELIVMDQGHPLLIGDTKEIFKAPKKMKVAKLTGCKNISPIKRLSSHELLAIDWQIKLKVSEPISEDIRYVGIRAHDIKICEEAEQLDGIPQENILSAQIISEMAYPFEMQYILKNKSDLGTEEIWLKVGNGRKIREEKINLQFSKENLMLLR